MFGKHFSSMYTGSMVGAGWSVFGVMGYVIANMRPDSVVGAQVELNPTIMATIFGADEKEVVDAIEFLCKPDPKTRTPDEDGRRLVRVGSFDYRVVNGAKYLAIRDEAERREANRLSQARCREQKKTKRVSNVPEKGARNEEAKSREESRPTLQPFVEHLARESVKFGDALAASVAPVLTSPIMPAPTPLTVPIIGKKVGLVVVERPL